MKKNKLYVTTMYKYGSREDHSYVLCVEFSKATAINKSKKETERRGNKYDAEVIEFEPGTTIFKTVYSKLD